MSYSYSAGTSLFAVAVVQQQLCVQMLLSSGVVCSAVVCAVTGDLLQLTSDKYLTGKLLSEHPAHGKA